MRKKNFKICLAGAEVEKDEITVDIVVNGKEQQIIQLVCKETEDELHLHMQYLDGRKVYYGKVKKQESYQQVLHKSTNQEEVGEMNGTAERTEKQERIYISTPDTARMIRTVLKANYPGFKFSVRSKSYSGGSSITVYWEDGPTTEEVDSLVKRFEGASFDGMIDLKSYHSSDLAGREVHFGADYVFTSRSFSVERTKEVLEEIQRDYDVPELPENPEIKAGWIEGGWNIKVNDGSNYDLQMKMNSKLHKKSYLKSKEVEVPEEDLFKLIRS
jgi:hypothetical protein